MVPVGWQQQRRSSGNVDSHHIRVAKEREALQVGVRDVDQRKVVDLAAGIDAAEHTRRVSLECLGLDNAPASEFGVRV